MSLNLEQLENDVELDIPGFKTHDGVRALAIRLMMTTAGKVRGGWRLLTKAQINELGEVPVEAKRSYRFDGQGSGELIYCLPCEDKEDGDLLWTDAIIAVEKALAWGLLPSQIWAYYIQRSLVVTLSYKVLRAWASLIRPFSIYYFEMTHEERNANFTKGGTDDINDVKVLAYLIDQNKISELGKLSLDLMDRKPEWSTDEALKQACRILRFSEGAGVVRGWEIPTMPDNSFTPLRRAKKRAVTNAIVEALGEPTVLGIRKIQSEYEQAAGAAITAGQVVEIPEHIPVHLEDKYIRSEVTSYKHTDRSADEVIRIMRGDPEEEYID